MIMAWGAVFFFKSRAGQIKMLFSVRLSEMLDWVDIKKNCHPIPQIPASDHSTVKRHFYICTEP